LKPCDWIETKDSKVVYAHLKHLINEESTVLSLMKESLKNNKDYSFCYDSIFGVQSRKDFVIKAYLIADLLKQIP
jgi:hypothetical protein